MAARTSVNHHFERIESLTMDAAEDVEIVALTPVCEGCLRAWLPRDSGRWRAVFVNDDGADDVLRFWCPDCWAPSLQES
jgi:hypothetical protein